MQLPDDVVIAEKLTRKCYNCGKPCGPEACPRCANYSEERDDG